MNKLSVEQRVRVLSALVDGNSIRATVRMTGVAKNTIVHLLEDVGAACLAYQQKTLVNLPCKRVQCDEIWAFVGMKERQVDPKLRGHVDYGDVWTWTAICADTKLIPCFHVGKRSGKDARVILTDLASRLAHRVQLTTDGHRANMTDKMERGRWKGGCPPGHGKGVRGSANRIARLTETDVESIRARVNAGEKQRKLAKEYGVGVATIFNAVRGLTWQHVPMRHAPPPKVNRKRRAHRFVETFGSAAYVEYLHSRPCDICGMEAGFTEAAHTRSRGAGGKCDDLVSLCGTRRGANPFFKTVEVGCHWKYDTHDPDARSHELRLRTLAKKLWKDWNATQTRNDE